MIWNGDGSSNTSSYTNLCVSWLKVVLVTEMARILPLYCLFLCIKKAGSESKVVGKKSRANWKAEYGTAAHILQTYEQYNTFYSRYRLGLKLIARPVYVFTKKLYWPSTARANLNKSKKILTSTTTASKYIPKRPRICINWNPPLSDLTS